MLDDRNLTKKAMAELTIFNDGSVNCKRIERTPYEDTIKYANSYKSIEEGHYGDPMTSYLLMIIRLRGLIK
jgi:hypothetical protein